MHTDSLDWWTPGCLGFLAPWKEILTHFLIFLERKAEQWDLGIVFHLRTKVEVSKGKQYTKM
jgi:hypothetical protein